MHETNAGIQKIMQLIPLSFPGGYIFYEYTRSNLFKESRCSRYAPSISFFGPQKRSSLVCDAEHGHFDSPDSTTPLYMYINIPFCRQKCSFCHYVTYPADRNQKLLDDYIQAVEREMRMHFPPAVSGRKPLFVAVGGGTPLVLSCAQLERLCRGIYKYGEGAKTKISFETTTVELLTREGAEKIKVLRKWGVRRVSIGVQSFDDNLLGRLGVRHTADQSCQAIALARKMGFEHINIDCMFGFPFADTVSWRKQTFPALSRLSPESVSLYQFRQDTVRSCRIARRHDRAYEDILCERIEMDGDLTGRGYLRCGRHYSRDPHIFREEKPIHDWMVLNGDWLACGVNARSTIGRRGYCNTRSIQRYISSLRRGYLPIIRTVNFSRGEKQKQFMIDKFVCGEGIDGKEFSRLFGCSFHSAWGKHIAPLVKEGILVALPEKIIIGEAYKLFDLEIINYLGRGGTGEIGRTGAVREWDRSAGFLRLREWFKKPGCHVAKGNFVESRQSYF